MPDAAGYPLKDGKHFSLEFTYMASRPSTPSPRAWRRPVASSARQKYLGYLPESLRRRKASLMCQLETWIAGAAAE
jgi:hypothetical protein